MNEPSLFRKLLRIWRKYIHCNHRFFYVHSTHCYKCKRKVRLTYDEYWSKKLNKEMRKQKWHSY